MKKSSDLSRTVVDSDDIDSNNSSNEQFSKILDARLSRRSMLRGGLASAATALFGSVGLTACGSDNDTPVTTTPVATVPPADKLLAFTAVGKTLADAVCVPAGYTAKVLYALGDQLAASTPAYKNDGTDGNWENRAGDHHDGMELFGLSATVHASDSSLDRVLLAVNHEATTDQVLSSFFIHPTGGTTTLPRPAAEVDKEVALHGVSVVEVRKTGGKWEYMKDSPFNHRVTVMTCI